MSLFSDYHDEIIKLIHFVTVCRRGITMGARATQIDNLMTRIKERLGEKPSVIEKNDAEPSFMDLKEIESFSKYESDKGFPYLYGLASVRLWGIIESLVDDIILTSLKDTKKIHKYEIVQNLKGPLLEFSSSTPDQQAEYLASEIKLSLRASLKLGIGRFETIVECVGLSGRIDKIVRKVFLELSQVRNLVVHKSSVVDKKFQDICPWLKSKVGQPLVLTASDFGLYTSVADWYLLELLIRTKRRDKITGRRETMKLQTSLMRIIRDIVKKHKKWSI